MRAFLYNFLTKAYFLIISFAALFNEKAGKFVRGRKNLISRIQKSLAGNADPIAWFHCASLGEFEQARPVIEAFRNRFPDYKIFLTFFSPSGYEIRKNYDGADYVFYLPNESSSNAKKFLDAVNPSAALFVKYEFWYHYLKELNRRNIPVVSFSAIFRENQLFFKPYGRFYKNILKLFNHIFVQNESSQKLLRQAGLTNVSLAGDTRFDRVKEIGVRPNAIAIAEKFKNDAPTLVAGSVWPGDMNALAPAINDPDIPLKYIIAPHNIHEAEIVDIEKSIKKKVVRYSKAAPETARNADVLIIDNIGMLSSLYRYGELAYVGGAFRKALHNTLEAAVYGIPVIFGKDESNLKFNEAVDLVAIGAAFEVKDAADLKNRIEWLLKNESERKRAADAAATYVTRQTGATNKIMKYIERLLWKKD